MSIMIGIAILILSIFTLFMLFIWFLYTFVAKPVYELERAIAEGDLRMREWEMDLRSKGIDPWRNHD